MTFAKQSLESHLKPPTKPPEPAENSALLDSHESHNALVDGCISECQKWRQVAGTALASEGIGREGLVEAKCSTRRHDQEGPKEWGDCESWTLCVHLVIATVSVHTSTCISGIP